MWLRHPGPTESPKLIQTGLLGLGVTRNKLDALSALDHQGGFHDPGVMETR